MNGSDPGWGWIKTKAEGPGPWEKGTALGKSLPLCGAEKVYGSELYSNFLKQNERVMVSHVGNSREEIGFRLGWIQGLN